MPAGDRVNPSRQAYHVYNRQQAADGTASWQLVGFWAIAGTGSFTSCGAFRREAGKEAAERIGCSGHPIQWNTIDGALPQLQAQRPPVLWLGALFPMFLGADNVGNNTRVWDSDGARRRAAFLMAIEVRPPPCHQSDSSLRFSAGPFCAPLSSLVFVSQLSSCAIPFIPAPER